MEKGEELFAEAKNQYAMAHHDNAALTRVCSLNSHKAKESHDNSNQHQSSLDDESSSTLVSEGYQWLDEHDVDLFEKRDADLFSGCEFRNSTIEAAHKNLLSAHAHLEGVRASLAARNWFVKQGGLLPSRVDETAQAIADFWGKAEAQFQTTSKQYVRAAEAEVNSNRFFSYLWSKIGRHSHESAEKYFQAAWHFIDGKNQEAKQLHQEAKASQQVAEALTQLAEDLQKNLESGQVAAASHLAELLSLETQPLEQKLAAAYEKALALRASDSHFEEAWSDAMDQAEQAKEDWIKVVQIYERLIETLPESDRASWNADLETARYMLTKAMMRPLLFQAEKESLIVEGVIMHAKNLPSNNSEFETVLESAISAALSSEQA